MTRLPQWQMKISWSIFFYLQTHKHRKEQNITFSKLKNCLKKKKYIHKKHVPKLHAGIECQMERNESLLTDISEQFSSFLTPPYKNPIKQIYCKCSMQSLIVMLY